MANDAWAALRNDATSSGAALPPEPHGAYDDLWRLLSVEAQQSVARGDVTLEELLERVTSAEGSELCPHCAKRPVRNPRVGLCNACATTALADAHNEAIRELEATRAYNTAKQRLKRLREELDVPAPGRHGRIDDRKDRHDA